MTQRLFLGIAIFSAACSALAGDPAPKVFQPAYGAAALSVLSIGAHAFAPWVSSDAYSPTGNGGLYPVKGSGAFAAPVFLPSGALVHSLTLLGCDNNTTGRIVAGLYRTAVDGKFEIATQLLYLNTEESGAPGCSGFPVAASSPITIDNGLGTYWAFVYMSDFGSDLSLTGVQIHYKLQMSPAPAVATFADVPASHPYFRAVEALAASGITGGCGNGNFCPDKAVTRGELAKFLANALGLSWGVADSGSPASNTKERQ